MELGAQFQKEDVPAKRSKRLKKLRLIIPAAVLLVGAAFGVRYYLGLPEDDALRLSGRIEGYESDVGTKVGGRIQSIAVREGDRVSQGQVIAQLDDAELEAQLEGAQARFRAAQQQESQARLQLEVIESQIREAQLNLQQSQETAQGQINQADAAVAAAQAQLAQAQAQAQQAAAEQKLAQVDRDRYSSLLQEGVISQQQFDQNQTRLETAQATLQARQQAIAAARRQVKVAQGELTQARSSRLNPDIRTAKLEGLQKQLAQAKSQLSAAQAEVASAKASQAETSAKLADLEIVSPINGVVLTRTSEPGEVLAVGQTVMTVVNLNDVYLRGYLPEGQVGEVRIGQPAKVFLDSAPEKPLSATVTEIDSEASFTPENIYFQEDRVTQVFGLKLDITNPAGFAKPGMPADGEIIAEDTE